MTNAKTSYNRADGKPHTAAEVIWPGLRLVTSCRLSATRDSTTRLLAGPTTGSAKFSCMEVPTDFTSACEHFSWIKLNINDSSKEWYYPVTNSI